MSFVFSFSIKAFAIGSKNTSYNLILLTLENKTWN